jgi:enamine deaminase RidA (YjgF/YER057c/UK114 family)
VASVHGRSDQSDDPYDANEFGFNQARIDNGTPVVSGQVGIGSERLVVAPDIEAQARKAFENLGSIPDAAGKYFDNVGKVTTYMVDLAQQGWGSRPVWTGVFDERYPCQTLIGGDQLSPFADGELVIEVEAEVSLVE